MYKKNPSYKGNLSKIEEANVFFLQAAEKYLSDEPRFSPPYSSDKSAGVIFYPSNQIISLDLDGDGKKEKICQYIYMPEDKDYGEYRHVLKVNDAVVELDFIDPVEALAIVDMNQSDDYLEIFIGDHGPSSDESTQIFRYKDHDLVKIGTVPGILGGIGSWGVYTNGSGFLKSWMRLGFSMTCHAPYSYYLDGDSLESPNSTGDIPVITPLVLKSKLQIYRDKNMKSSAITLNSGTPILAIKTDQLHWIQVVAPGDKIGWFYVSEDWKINNTSSDPENIFDNMMIYD